MLNYHHGILLSIISSHTLVLPMFLNSMYMLILLYNLNLQLYLLLVPVYMLMSSLIHMLNYLSDIHVLYHRLFHRILVLPNLFHSTLLLHYYFLHLPIILQDHLLYNFLLLFLHMYHYPNAHHFHISTWHIIH